MAGAYKIHTHSPITLRALTVGFVWFSILSWLGQNASFNNKQWLPVLNTVSLEIWVRGWSLRKVRRDKKERVLDEGCPLSFMHALGSGPTLLLGAQAWKCFWKGKQRPAWEKCSSSFLVLRCSFTLSMWIQGSQTHRVKARGTGMTWLNFGILVMNWHRLCLDRFPHRRPGHWLRGPVGIRLWGPGLGVRTPRWQAGLMLHEHICNAVAQGPQLRKIPCLKLNALWLTFWNV